MKISKIRIFNIYMSFIGVAGQLVFFAQAYKIFASKSSQDVSAFGFSMGLLSVSSWLVYGIVIRNFPLILANAIAVIGALSVLFGIVYYR